MARTKQYERRLGGGESFLKVFNVDGRIEVESPYYDEDMEYQLQTIDTIVKEEMLRGLRYLLRGLNG